MEAAGEMLQHPLSLLGLSDEYNYFQERPVREIKHIFYKAFMCQFFLICQCVQVKRRLLFLPEGMIHTLPGEVKESEVFLADSTAEVVTRGTNLIV